MRSTSSDNTVDFPKKKKNQQKTPKKISIYQIHKYLSIPT